MSIFQFINEIENGEIVLPAIQRDFVWDTDRITLLFDSVMRGYPIGIVLLWETYQPLQYRQFVRHFKPDDQYTFIRNTSSKRIKIVLDGQQRLSSIYVGLSGTLDNETLYFDILSGSEVDDHSQRKFSFQFSNLASIVRRNATTERRIEEREEADDSTPISYWLPFGDLIGRNPIDMLRLRDEVSTKLQLSPEDRLRMEHNLLNASFAFSENAEVLKTQTIDHNLPAEDHRRKSVFDILEIFVRINTQGVSLRRSDIIVSILRLYWEDASDILPTFIREINERIGIEMDTDFMLRCMFSAAGIGTRLDFELLRTKSNVDRIKETHAACFQAVRSVVDFARTDCGIDSARLLGGIGTLVPFVQYAFSAEKHRFHKQTIDSARKSLFLFAFAKIFTQYAESRTGAFIRDYLSDAEAIRNGAAFPYDKAILFVFDKTNFNLPDDTFFGNNPELALSLLQKKNGGTIKNEDNLPEMDHIFPRSVLEDRGYERHEINDIGNLWLLPRGVNRNKSAKNPRDFLERVSPTELSAALINPAALSYRGYRSFIRERHDAMVSRLSEITGITEADFAGLKEF